MCQITKNGQSTSSTSRTPDMTKDLDSISRKEQTYESQGLDEKTGNDDKFGTLPRSVQLITLTIGMCVFFGTHNVMQEAFMKIPNYNYAVMLGYMEMVGVSLGSYLERKYIAKETGHKAPFAAYTLLTFCLLSSSALCNWSLNYINYPTKVVFRSCKLLPTMVMATAINRKKFSSLEYVLAMAVCAGLIFFAAADWRLSPSFNPLGLILVSLSVVADSILPNAQEALFDHGSSRLEVTLYSNLFTLSAMTITTMLSGDFFGFIRFFYRETQMIPFMVVYSMVAFIAISFFMQIVKRFGAVVGVLAATARKALTLLLSFLIFPKDFSWYYVIGSILVLGGLLASSLVKIRKKNEELARLPRRLSMERPLRRLSIDKLERLEKPLRRLSIELLRGHSDVKENNSDVDDERVPMVTKV